MKLWHFLVIYLLLINLAAFVAMGADKARARRRTRRTPEATLLLLAVIGGSVGALAGMLLFRHKTRHIAFSLGLPLLFLLHCALIAVLFHSYALNC